MRRPIHPESPLQTQVRARTRTLLEAAASWSEIRRLEPEIRFDLRGMAAGQARFAANGPWVIRYNALLLGRHPEEFMAQTVPHEVAHLVAYALHGPSIRPHGPEWQGIMGRFGADPARCHRYDVSQAQARTLSAFDYHCDCRDHTLSSIRHHRVLAGQTYVCRHCAAPLRAGFRPRKAPAS